MRPTARFPTGHTWHGPVLVRVFGVLFAVEAVLVALNAVASHWTWNLSLKRNVPTFYHSAILVAVALSLWCIGGFGVRVAAPGRPAGVPGAALAGHGSPVPVPCHRRGGGDSRTGQPKVWQTLGMWDWLEHIWEAAFAPLFGLIALLMLTLMLRHRRHLAAFLWLGLAALALWGTALVLELMQLTFLPSRQPWYALAVNVEETLEMVASTLFLLGCALLLRRILGRDHPKPAVEEREGATPLSPIQALSLRKEEVI